MQKGEVDAVVVLYLLQAGNFHTPRERQRCTPAIRFILHLNIPPALVLIIPRDRPKFPRGREPPGKADIRNLICLFCIQTD